MKRSNPRLAQMIVLLLSSAMVGAQTTPPRSSGQQFRPNFQQQDVSVIADAVTAATGIKFIIDQRAQTRISLGNSEWPAMTAQQFYNAFVAALQVYGLAAVKADDSGRLMKIVPETTARNMPSNDFPANLNSIPADDLVSTIVTVKNINPVQLATVLRTIVMPTDNLTPIQGTQQIAISGRASSVRRMIRLIQEADQTPNTEVQVIRLENAVAKDAVTTINQLLTPKGGDAAAGTVQASITSDDRTNSLLIVGDPAQRLRIAALVEYLDIAGADGGGTQVIKLNYADAEDIATTLNAQIKGTTSTTSGSGGTSSSATGTPGPANSATAVADRNVMIQAHAATNSLLITSQSPRTMQSLKTLIDALDKAPEQVHIEAIVAEITDRKAADLGVNWAVFSTDENTSVPISGFLSPIGGVSLDQLAGAVVDPEAAIAAGAMPQGATFAVGKLKDTGTSFAAMFRALKTEGNNNIVSLPNVTTTNNLEAEMTSGQQVPFLTNQVTNTGAGLGGNNGLALTNSVQRQRVGTTLKVTPQIISETDEVILKIELTSSELSGKSGDAGSLITNERTVKTSVRVRSGSTIVIGGMIKNDNDDSETRIPLLSKIPLVGELFRTRSGTREKSNMMIFIQPRILRDAVQANAETAARYNSLRETEARQKARRELLPLLPKDKDSALPDLGPPPAPTATKP